MTEVSHTPGRTDATGGPRPITPPRWGRVISWPSRYGACRRRVVVLAPGSTTRDARLWRLSVEYPVVGGVVAMVGYVCVGSLIGPVAGLWLMLCGYTAGHLLVAHVSAAVRHGSRELTICTGLTPEPLPSASLDLLFWQVVALLSTADEALRAGRIDRASHELAWSTAWEVLPERSR